MNRIEKLMVENDVLRYGVFKVSSGKIDTNYLDHYVFLCNPYSLNVITDEILSSVDMDQYDRIASIEMGSIPLAVSLSLYTFKPYIIVRKKKKEHGLKKIIEGEINPGDRIVILEDVTATGQTLLNAIYAIEDNQGIITNVIIIIDREEGAEERLKELGYNVQVLAKFKNIIDNTTKKIVIKN